MILSSALLLMILTTATYYAYGITRWTSFGILVIWAIVVWVVVKKGVMHDPPGVRSASLTDPASVTPIKSAICNLKSAISFLISHFSFPLAIFLLLETFLFYTLITHRTTDLMPSPWQAVGPWFFLAYAAATGVLFWIVAKIATRSADESPPPEPTFVGTPKIVFALTSLHLFLTWSITAILYPLGWGFDAFVHRATESWIATHGYILPKLPYYIGQYSFIAWLHNITGISIYWLDVLLVPVAASLLLPPAVYRGLRSAINIPPKFAALAVWMIPFVPFLSLNLTTPHNVVLLLAMLFVFTLLKNGVTGDRAEPQRGEGACHGGWTRSLAAARSRVTPFVNLLLIASVALVTHPLLGFPLFLTAIFTWIIKKIKFTKCVLSALFVSVALAAPALFTANNLRVGAGWPTFTNPFSNLGHFFALFERPYWYLKNAPLLFEILYGWERLIVPSIIALAVVGIVILKKQNQKSTIANLKSKILVTVALALATSGWLLRSWIIFPDVVAYEQGDFPLRLIKASLIFLLPLAMYGLYVLTTIPHRFRVVFRIGSAIAIPLILMLSLYLSYPQRNIKARFPGFNVKASDFKAVEWIHNRHTDYNYIVLSNQLVSAAALTKYSFDKYFPGDIFYYALPTGGPQYQDYGRMLYQGQKREYMLSAMDRAGVDTGYFLVNKYWANSDKIIEGAKLSADEWEVIEDGKVWVFVYKRNEE